MPHFSERKLIHPEGTNERDRVDTRGHARASTWLAWSLCTVCVALIALALLLDFLTGELPPYMDRLSPGLAVLAGALSLVYPTVGALIVSRLPRNPIGWIFCGLGLLYAARRFALAYTDYTLFSVVPLR